MAGFLFNLDRSDSLLSCIDRGIYSTRLSAPKNGIWRSSQEGTFADYCSMKAGDNIYFFIDRRIYGIGSLVNIGDDCKFLNYPGANFPLERLYEDVIDELLLDLGDAATLNHRFLCTFVPFPIFFKHGIDMDETLSSAPEKFRILRAFWKRSFIKFSDDENQAFKDIILRRNLNAINEPTPENSFTSNSHEHHLRIKNLIRDNERYRLHVSPLLSTISEQDNSVRHEMAVEAALLYQLSSQDGPTLDVFGQWDYLSHQVIASPFKPVDYMDKMDIFGYKYINDQKPTISNFLVVEIKRKTIEAQDVLQLMKYVDWVKNEYAFGDYSMIKAFMVGFNFTQEALDNFKEYGKRKYIHGVRPSTASEWSDIKLVKYRYNPHTELLDFEDVTP